jgi:uncharacterized membrane protein
MNIAHIHLLVNHLPIIGSLLGAFVLAQGLLTKSNQTKIAAYNIFLISAVGAGIAYLTGEAAEESVENIKGILESNIERHEEFALYALISLIILGAASILALFLNYRKYKLTRKYAIAVLCISLISFGLVARTGYLGGQIRHTELNSESTSNPSEYGEEENRD